MNWTWNQPGYLLFLLTPTNARSLAHRGWTKRDVKAYIIENARTPKDHRPGYYIGVEDGGQPTNDQKLVSIFRPDPRYPDPIQAIQVFVVGGMGSWRGLLSGGGPWGPVATEKVELPQNWEKLVAKYKRIVPTYVRY